MNDDQFEKLRSELGTSRRVSDLERDVAVMKSQIETIHAGMVSIRDLPMEVAAVSTGVDQCAKDTAYLRTKLEEREKERKQEREEARKEKKADRRWLVGIVFTAGGFIVAAIAFLVGVL